MKPDPLSGMASGAKTVLSAVFSFYLGLLLGSILVFLQQRTLMDFNWAWMLIWWISWIFMLLTSFPGILTLILLVGLLLGLIWGEWNRLIGTLLAATLLSTGIFIRWKINPFTAETPTLFWILTALILLPLLFAATIKIIHWHKQR